MKKVSFIIVLFIALFLLSDSLLAKSNSEYEAAMKLYNSKDYEGAVSLLKTYVEKYPDPAAYYRIGYALYELGKYDEAAKYFMESYLIDPKSSMGITAPYKKSPEAPAKEQPLMPSE